MKYAIAAFMAIVTFPLSASAVQFKTEDGVTIDYEVRGDGEALVLLHSGMMSREDMRVQIEHFSHLYKVIALDSREQGRSSSTEEEISYALMAADVVALLDHLQIEKANMFGQSDGGVTGLMAAHLYPKRLNKLIIHGAVYNIEAYPAEQRQGWMLTVFDENNPEDMDPKGFPGMAISHYLLGRDDLVSFESHLQEMSKLWATSPTLNKSDLNNIQAPVLVIVGDHYDISINHTVSMHEALPNSELFIAPGATHFIHHEKPDLLHKVIGDFLKE